MVSKNISGKFGEFGVKRVYIYNMDSFLPSIAVELAPARVGCLLFIKFYKIIYQMK